MIVYFPPFRHSLIWTFKNPGPGAGHDCDPTVECAETVCHLSSSCRVTIKLSHAGSTAWPALAELTTPTGVSSASLGDPFIAKLLVHGKAAEVSTSALDAFLGIKLEIVVVEKWSGRETDVGADTQRSDGTQPGLDAPIEKTGDTAPSELGMGKEKVQIAVERIRGETCECVV